MTEICAHHKEVNIADKLSLSRSWKASYSLPETKGEVNSPQTT
jgi:hypothetical protein